MGPRSLDRDLRIDFFRGLALVVIYVDHIPLDRLSHLTPRNFGFTSAADIFVLLAGISFALAYSPRLDTGGLKLMLSRVARRLSTIYVAHVVMLITAIVLLAEMNRNSPFDLYFTSPVRTWAGVTLPSAAAMTLTLKFQPPYFDILPLYLALLVLGVPLLLLARMHWGLAISASAAVWSLADAYRVNIPSIRSEQGWFFDPLTWQVVFAIGLCVGLRMLRGASLKIPPWLAPLCLLYLLAILAIVTPCRHNVLSSYCYFEDVSRFNWLLDRQTLWRIGNTLAWTFLVTLYIPASARWLTSRPAQVLTLMGRNSLAVFCAGTLLALVVRVTFAGSEIGWPFQVAVNVCGAAFLALIAYWLDKWPNARRSAWRTARLHS
jgi:hypothetical protein